MCFISVHIVTGKPNSMYDTEDGAEDSKRLEKSRLFNKRDVILKISLLFICFTNYIL